MKREGGHLVPMQEVEVAAHDLFLAIERLTRALDAVDDDHLACQYVPFKTWFSLEQLALRVSSGQKLD